MFKKNERISVKISVYTLPKLFKYFCFSCDKPSKPLASKLFKLGNNLRVFSEPLSTPNPLRSGYNNAAGSSILDFFETLLLSSDMLSNCCWC